MRQLYHVLFVIGAAFLASLLMINSPDLPNEPQLPAKVKDFSLTTTNGQSFTNNSLKNKWTLMFLGYTNCPDICPLSVAKLAKLEKQLNQYLSKDALPFQFVFVSIDPKRDSLEKLQAYLSYFSPSIIGATGTDEELFRILDTLESRDQFQRPQGVGQENEIIHPTNLYLFNPKGEWAAVFLEKEPAPQLLAKVNRFLSL